ncbi:MAG: hypothetical protein J7M21_00385, partial [Planctomycetes bacterium]|nr:hypothetical protein [Planctomycetota bacterium]
MNATSLRAACRTAAGLAIVIAAATSTGQVRQVQDGQTLDANPRIGSFRYNTPLPQSQAVNSQLYVTGQVRGLGYFHGPVGYRASNELGTVLPSSALMGFRRASVGLSDVLAGQTYLPAPHYDRTATTYNASQYATGQAGPGGMRTLPATAPLGSS